MPVEQFSSVNLRPHVHLSSYIRMFMDYLNTQVYAGEMENLIVGNYNKTLRYLNDYKTRNLDNPLLPLLSGTFQLTNLDEKTNHTWKHMARNQNYLASRLYKSVYEDDHVMLNVIFERFMGTSEVILIAHSSPQLQDYQFLSMQWFDLNKWFVMPRFDTRLLVPVEMIDYNYVNEAINDQYTVDLGPVTNSELIRSMDQQHFVFPIKSRPMARLTSVSDGTTFYGGAELPAFRLNLTFEWDIELPAYVVLHTDFKIDHIKKRIMVNGEITTDFVEPDDPGLKSTQGPSIIKLGDSIIEDGKMAYQIRVRHDIVIPEDHNDHVDFDLALPEPKGNNYLVLVSYWGVMREDYEYSMKDDSTITIKVRFNKDDYISVYYYEPM